MEPLYLDHAATSPPLPEALAAFERACLETPANPGSPHRAGAAAALALEDARETVRRALGAPEHRLVWTSCGSEANALGILGLARAHRRRAEKAGGGRARVLVGAAEHPSALLNARALVKEGFVVDEVPVDAAAVVRPDALAERLGPDVALVVVQWANNEIGSLNPVAELTALTRRLAPQAAFHCDAVQAAGKRPEPIASLGADAVAVAAHKLGGVRGIAALLLAPDAREPRPLWGGGGHEGGLRSGTENVMGAVAFAAAARRRRADLDADPETWSRRRSALLEALRAVAPDLVVVGADDEPAWLGSILSVAFPGFRARTLLTALEAEGVFVGSGSACHGSGPERPSPVLLAAGCPEELLGSVLRFSLGGHESEADAARAAAALARARTRLAGGPAARDVPPPRA